MENEVVHDEGPFNQTKPYSFFCLRFDREHVKPELSASLGARSIVNAGMKPDGEQAQ
jgi:hypothetical protein